MTVKTNPPSAAARRAEVLRDIHGSGSVQGVNKVMLERFKAKGYLQQEKGGAWTLTKMGKAVMEGRIGAAGRGAVDMGSARHKAQRSGPGGRSGSRTRGRDMAQYMLGDGTTARKEMEKDEKKYYEEHGDRLKAEYDKATATYTRAVSRILGPKGEASAVKIARADGQPLERAELEGLSAVGWGIYPAGTVAAQVGKSLPGYPVAMNPTEGIQGAMGDKGQARAVVISAPGINEEMLFQLRAAGYDLSPAPKALREGLQAKPNHGTSQDPLGPQLISVGQRAPKTATSKKTPADAG